MSHALPHDRSTTATTPVASVAYEPIQVSEFHPEATVPTATVVVDEEAHNNEPVVVAVATPLSTTSERHQEQEHVATALATALATAVVVEVEAPTDLQPGYEFPVTTREGRVLWVAVPLGQPVRAGQHFHANVLSTVTDESPSSQRQPSQLNSNIERRPTSTTNESTTSTTYYPRYTIPKGRWRDGPWNCCTHGICHPTLCWSFWCWPAMLGALLKRYQINTCGKRDPHANPCVGLSLIYIFGAFCCVLNSIFHTTAVVWLVLIGSKLRRLMRRTYGIRQEYCCQGMEDCCCIFWCHCCAVAQMARHVVDYTVVPADCTSPLGNVGSSRVLAYGSNDDDRQGDSNDVRREPTSAGYELPPLCERSLV